MYNCKNYKRSDSRILFLNRHTTVNDEFKLHSHDCYEIIYFLSGNGIIIIDGVKYPVSADSCCIVPPKALHTEQLQNYGEIIFVGFSCDDIGPDLNKKPVVTNKIMRVYFEKIIDEYTKQEFGYEVAAKSLLELLFIMYLRANNAESKKCKDMVFIKSYIEQYYNKKINFSELAILSGYSYDYFRYVFKKEFGCSPQNYMINTRINNAKKLLVSTNLSCTEIAYNCGFSNGAQMTSIIKNKLGKTPMELRKHRLV